MGNCCGTVKPSLLPEPEPGPPVLPPKPRTLVAIHNFRANNNKDLSFRKGDQMKVLEDSSNGWIKVHHLCTLKKGFVPVKFVADVLSLESYDWFFNISSRKEAEILLLGDATQPVGTYLIRYSSHGEAYTLSIKSSNLEQGVYVQHCRIYETEQGKLYIKKNIKYRNLPDLVSAISKRSADYDFVLEGPCKKPDPTIEDLSSDYRDKWEINRSEMEIFEKLGSGNFGEVFRSVWNNSEEVAVKTIVNRNTAQEFLREVGIMKKLRHPNLVQLYGVCTLEEPLLMVLEFMENGSVKNYLRKDRGRTAKFNELISIANNVAHGMDHLEKNHFVHRDLAARNVLLDSHLRAKICDFGLANLTGEGVQDGKLPIRWTAPEAIESKIFTHKSDVWSYGVLLMELFTYGETPYDGMTPSMIVDMVKEGWRLPPPKNYPMPDIIYDQLIRQCWKEKPYERPNFKFFMDFFECMEITYQSAGTEKQKPFLPTIQYLASVIGHKNTVSLILVRSGSSSFSPVFLIW